MSVPSIAGNEALGVDLKRAIERLGYVLCQASEHVDLVIVELGDADAASALAWALELHERWGAPILCVARPDHQSSLAMARGKGIAGCLVRPVHPAQLKASIELALGARARLPRAYQTARSGTHAIEAGVADGDSASLAVLSSREREVFDCLVTGQRVAEISALLFISRHTVRQHVKAIFRKLGMHSHVELMRRYGVASNGRRRRKTTGA